MWTARVLVAAVLVVCVASSADARRRHHGYYGYSERYSARGSLDQARGDGQDQDLGQDRRKIATIARGTITAALARSMSGGARATAAIGSAAAMTGAAPAMMIAGVTASVRT